MKPTDERSRPVPPLPSREPVRLVDRHGRRHEHPALTAPDLAVLAELQREMVIGRSLNQQATGRWAPQPQGPQGVRTRTPAPGTGTGAPQGPTTQTTVPDAREGSKPAGGNGAAGGTAGSGAVLVGYGTGRGTRPNHRRARGVGGPSASTATGGPPPTSATPPGTCPGTAARNEAVAAPRTRLRGHGRRPRPLASPTHRGVVPSGSHWLPPPGGTPGMSDSRGHA